MSEVASGSSAAPVIRLTKVGKSYNGTHALAGVDFDVRPGEVHAVLGENGAGKSTMVKIISGAVAHDTGTLEIAGRERTFATPRESVEAGVAMVYQ